MSVKPLAIPALDFAADITDLRGAEYNPRHIDEADLKRLAESITTLGLVKPVIVRGDLLVAGHQRTKALRRLGINTAAMYRLPCDTTVYDEVRFNQLHNGTDMDCGDENARIEGGFETSGYHVVNSKLLKANFRGKMAGVREDIARMIHKYGPWGGVVAARTGEIFHAAQYAIAARLTGVPLTVYVMPDELVEPARKMLSRQYGVFSYDHLEKATYIQTLAQMNRLRAGPSGKENKSTLYETMVIPFIGKPTPSRRFIDFGAGHGDYAAAMRGRGHDFHDVELFRRTSTATLDERAVNRMISRMCDDMTNLGAYDAVVMDSVLNSVDCPEAESAVLTICNMLTKPGATFFASGRPAEANDSIANFTIKAEKGQRRSVEFLDDKGFTAILRQGQWFYQKYHRKAEIVGLFSRFGFKVEKHTHGGNSWQVQVRKIAELSLNRVEAAIDFEFNLPFGETKRIGRHCDVKAAYRAMLQARQEQEPSPTTGETACSV